MSDWTAIGANVATMIVSAGSVAGMLYGAVIRPSRQALAQALVKLDALQKARLVERLDEHGIQLEELQAHHQRCATEILPMHATKSDLATSVASRDTKLREIERTLDQHSDILARLDERSKNTSGWLETVDGRLEEVTRGLARLAGRGDA